MAEIRKINKTIVLSDRFVSLPIFEQFLYFVLNMYALEKGVLINARTVTKSYGLTLDVLDGLVESGFIEPIEDDRYRIVDWAENQSPMGDRNTHEYRKWREAVLERDGFQCAQCGSAEKLVVHHIKPYRGFPKLRLDVDNGITLCDECHKKAHVRRRKNHGEEEDV